uniref:Glutathione S-transferase n=1 Tax=Hucho hucho TaxID=62062 RepID=A0A4W5L858_9TELE
MQLTLYGNRFSGHSYKVRLALVLAGLAHDYRHVSLSLPHAERPADFRAASRWQEVPALVVDGVAMVQSNAILQWLASEQGVLGGTAAEAAALREWLSWEANRIGFSLPNLRYSRQFSPQGTAVEAWLEQRCRADLDVLNAQLAQQDYLLASGLSVADLSASAYLWWLADAALDIRDWPHVARWLAPAAMPTPRRKFPDAKPPVTAGRHRRCGQPAQ